MPTLQKCPECRKSYFDDLPNCPHCGAQNATQRTATFPSTGQQEAPISQQEAPPRQRYPALRTISSVYRGLAVMTGVCAIIIVIIGISQLNGHDGAGPAVGVPLIVGGFVGGFFGVISSLAAAEIINVFLDIEDNTRNTFYTVWNSANK